MAEWHVPFLRARGAYLFCCLFPPHTLLPVNKTLSFLIYFMHISPASQQGELPAGLFSAIFAIFPPTSAASASWPEFFPLPYWPSPSSKQEAGSSAPSSLVFPVTRPVCLSYRGRTPVYPFPITTFVGDLFYSQLKTLQIISERAICNCKQYSGRGRCICIAPPPTRRFLPRKSSAQMSIMAALPSR